MVHMDRGREIPIHIIGPLDEVKYENLITKKLEVTARYAGFTSSSCGELRPPAEVFVALWAKKPLHRPKLSAGARSKARIAGCTF